jgi:hypothetical protein
VPRTALRDLDGVGMDFQCNEWRGWGDSYMSISGAKILMFPVGL